MKLIDKYLCEDNAFFSMFNHERVISVLSALSIVNISDIIEINTSIAFNTLKKYNFVIYITSNDIILVEHDINGKVIGSIVNFSVQKISEKQIKESALNIFAIDNIVSNNFTNRQDIWKNYKNIERKFDKWNKNKTGYMTKIKHAKTL